MARKADDKVYHHKLQKVLSGAVSRVLSRFQITNNEDNSDSEDFVKTKSSKRTRKPKKRLPVHVESDDDSPDLRGESYTGSKYLQLKQG